MKWFLIFLFFIFVGCKESATYVDGPFYEIDKTKTYKNPMVPTELKNKIFVNESQEQGAHSEENAPLKRAIEHPFGKLPTKVYLIEKTPGTLIEPRIQIKYDLGGGELDLAEFVKENRRGTFHFAVTVESPEDSEATIWYLSHAKIRKLRDESVGSGCGSYFNITDYFLKQMKKDGLSINTTDQRYVSALVGTYIFVYKKSKDTSLSILDVFDSRYSDLECK